MKRLEDDALDIIEEKAREMAATGLSCRIPGSVLLLLILEVREHRSNRAVHPVEDGSAGGGAGHASAIAEANRGIVERIQAEIG